MVRRKEAQREEEPGEAEGAARQSSPSWTNLERLPPPPQMPADGVSLIAPKWTRGRGNDHAEANGAYPATHHERTVLGRIARYEVLGRVHLGRNVSVYLARSAYPKLELVALKVSRGAVVGTPSEKPGPTTGSWSDALRAVAHPNLCTLIEITQHESLKCVAHAWLDGVPLDRLLSRLTVLEKPLPPHLAASIVGQLAAGIDHAEHMLATRGVPESAGPTTIFPNDVMLCADGRAVLLDLRWRDAPEAASRAEPLKARKSVQILGELLAMLTQGAAPSPSNEHAPFSFRVSAMSSTELAEIIDRTRPDHAAPLNDALALSTALQHFVGYESNQEERQAIAEFVNEKFPDVSAREPHIQTGPDVRRAIQRINSGAEQLASTPPPKLTDVHFGAEKPEFFPPWMWLVGGLSLLVCIYVLRVLF